MLGYWAISPKRGRENSVFILNKIFANHTQWQAIRCVRVCVCVCVFGCSVMSDYLRPHGLQPARLLCPRDSLGKNTGVGCHSLLWGISQNQGSHSGLPALQADSLPSESPGKQDFRNKIALILRNL